MSKDLIRGMGMDVDSLLRVPLDEERLREEFSSARPFPHTVIPNFLAPDFAERIAQEFPDLDTARRTGREFQAVNERGKTQVTDARHFPEPIRQLHELLASTEILETLSRITAIPKLIPDPELVGGGIHMMAPGAHLDVHVDFNRIEDRGLFRRLNLLLFLNPRWQEGWGGELELWDREVKEPVKVYTPRFNHLAFFATSERSFHGVRKITSPPGESRQSFAGYYYTRECPPEWSGESHSTIFRARPEERWKANVLMPAEQLIWKARRNLRRIAGRLRRF